MSAVFPLPVIVGIYFRGESSAVLDQRMTLLGSVQRLARLAPGRAQFSSSAPVRGGAGWSYRTTPPPTSKNFLMGSKIIMTFTWWWIFHGRKLLLLCALSFLKHLSPGIFTEPAHIFPFWDNYPDPEKWTDAQLGIPADDE